MDSNDFYTFAGGIAVQPNKGAAAYRSAASRAYYSAYHAAISFLAQMSFHCRGDGISKHQWVQQCLLNCNVAIASEVGSLLGNLQQSRNEADYDLHKTNPDGQSFAKMCVERANVIFSKIEICKVPETQAEINKGLLEYRRLSNR